MHPFVHPFNPAIAHHGKHALTGIFFTSLAKAFLDLARELNLNQCKEVVATPLLHDTPARNGSTIWQVKDWSKGECEPIPGKTMPQIHVVERDYKRFTIR